VKQSLLPLAATAGLLLWPQPTVRAELDSDPGNFKVEICHVPPGNPENAHLISVSIFALPAHLGHGDPWPGYHDPNGPCGSGDPTQT
jgi:hypothetical protein